MKPPPPPRGQMVGIGRGRALHVMRAGPSEAPPPLVVLEAGSFGFSADWAVVQQQLAERGMSSIAYDRAGLGHSPAGPAPRDSVAVSEDLEALLAALGVRGALIHVGHSMAGFHAQVFAGRNRERIAGLVLVDAITPASARRAEALKIAGHYVRLAKGAAWAAGAGWLRPFGRFGDTIGLVADATAHKRWAFAHPEHNRAASAEVATWFACIDQAEAAGPLDPTWPLAVVTAGSGLANDAQRQLMAEPARASAHGLVLHEARASHASLLGRKHASTIVRAIEHVKNASGRT